MIDCELYPAIYKRKSSTDFSPSACNTQPWIVEHTENLLKVYRYRKPGKRGIMPANKE